MTANVFEVRPRSIMPGAELSRNCHCVIWYLSLISVSAGRRGTASNYRAICGLIADAKSLKTTKVAGRYCVLITSTVILSHVRSNINEILTL